MAAAPKSLKDLYQREVRFQVTVSTDLVGIMILLAVWWFGGWLIAGDDLSAFGFARSTSMHLLIFRSIDLTQTIISSLFRVGAGLLWGFVIGVPVGILIGYVLVAMRVANVRFSSKG